MTDKVQSQLPARQSERGMSRRSSDWITEMQEEMGRLMGAMGSWPFGRSLQRMMPAALTPRTDVYEQDNMLVIKSEMPGIRPEDLDVSLEEGDLIIKGERKSEEEVREENFYRMERSSGSFYRRIPLPQGVDPEQIQANLKDGLLEIRIPQPPEQKPQSKKITVSAAQAEKREMPPPGQAGQGEQSPTA